MTNNHFNDEEKDKKFARPDLAVYLSGFSYHGLDSYAYARQTARLSAGMETTGIAFDCFDSSDDGDFEIDEEFITINKPGTYLITYIISVPQSADVDTTFRLMTENRPLPGASLRVKHSCTTDDASFTVSTVVRINERTTLTLTPDKTVNYTVIDEEISLASLTILKLHS